jgi:cold shock protein
MAKVPTEDDSAGMATDSPDDLVTVEILSDEDAFPDGFRVAGHVKWFDATRGFGFMVSDQCDGDVLIHFSVLRDHGRRSLPEGALVECIAERQERGLQARKILAIDLSQVLPGTARPFIPSADRADRKALADAAGPFEAVEVKWFNRVKGYGFLNRVEDPDSDIFVHMETVRSAEINDLVPGDRLEARIAAGKKGLTAVELRRRCAGAFSPGRCCCRSPPASPPLRPPWRWSARRPGLSRCR